MCNQGNKLKLIPAQKRKLKIQPSKKTLRIKPGIKSKNILQFPFTVDCNQGYFTDADNWTKTVHKSGGNTWSVNESALRLEFAGTDEDGGFLYVPLGFALGGVVDVTMRVTHPGEADGWTGVAFRAKDPSVTEDTFVAYYRFRGASEDEWNFIRAQNVGQSSGMFSPSVILTGEDRNPQDKLWLRMEISGQWDVGNGVRVRVKDWADGDSEPSTWKGESFSTNSIVPDTGGIGVFQALGSSTTHVECISISVTS